MAFGNLLHLSRSVIHEIPGMCGQMFTWSPIQTVSFSVDSWKFKYSGIDKPRVFSFFPVTFFCEWDRCVWTNNSANHCRGLQWSNTVAIIQTENLPHFVNYISNSISPPRICAVRCTLLVSVCDAWRARDSPTIGHFSLSVGARGYSQSRSYLSVSAVTSWSNILTPGTTDTRTCSDVCGAPYLGPIRSRFQWANQELKISLTFPNLS